MSRIPRKFFIGFLDFLLNRNEKKMYIFGVFCKIFLIFGHRYSTLLLALASNKLGRKHVSLTGGVGKERGFVARIFIDGCRLTHVISFAGSIP